MFYRVFASTPLRDSAARDALREWLLAQGWKVEQQFQGFGFEGNYQPRSSMPLLKVLPSSKSKTTSPATGPAGSLSTVWVQTDKLAGEVFNHYSAQLKAAA